MRYVQLRAFHYVAICGGFSRAAEELLLTQPAISDQVRKLEEEYDVLLFNRMRKQVTLTSAGEDLLKITHRLFDSEQQASDLLSESRALQSGHLRIVADSAHHLLQILATFRDMHPRVSISIRSGNTETVIDSLYEYRADIGILGEMPTLNNFECLRLSSSPIIAFVARDHELAGTRSMTLAEFRGHSLVLRERGSKTRTKLEQAARAAGAEMRATIEAEGREAVRELVASGAGVGFVSMAEFSPDTRLVPIEITPTDGLIMDEALVCLKERRHAKLVNAFFTIAQKR